ncbi:alpha/beta hydrolase-fold protein [Nocardioides sp.]|uniref:alpha/beta hydrolase n=1 Tax=Nocardioides sp. TaxID=35761 RepID=UPI00238EB5D2|nr:alpha/beta hydrolase-fold protein [Nocardioides sp.]MDE0776688.1 alpha/beta hydrolase-fold protein [Nocardioides sp.]
MTGGAGGRRIGRRTLLTAGLAGAAGAGLGIGTGLSLDARTSTDDGPRSAAGSDERSGTVRPGPVVRDTFVSAARGGVATRWSLIRPPDVVGPLPLVVALHGHGGSTDALLAEPWDLPGALARAVSVDGVAPFAVATASGGTTFWHERPWGEDAGAMVLDELLPMLLARDDILVEPIGMLGWSMGGYGVLRLAALLGPGRVAAVVASSPGLYDDPARAHPNGFADEAEYARFSVMGRQGDLAGIPVRVDIGTEDPFFAATKAYVDGFAPQADIESHYSQGGHEIGYTRRVMPGELAWLGERVGRE